ncbi:MAG: hypothetical protein AAF267_00325, partial [Deinococcota bacterium]
RMEEAQLPAGPVNDILQMHQDPQVIAREMIVEVGSTHCKTNAKNMTKPEGPIAGIHNKGPYVVTAQMMLIITTNHKMAITTLIIFLPNGGSGFMPRA